MERKKRRKAGKGGFDTAAPPSLAVSVASVVSVELKTSSERSLTSCSRKTGERG